MDGLSICIPVYNFNCIESVKILCEQIQNLSLTAEIIVLDDASTIEFKDLKSFKSPYYKYEKLNKNIGRSKIRNLLAEKSKFEYLLFIDADSGIPKNFIKNYLSSIKANRNSIICGGRIHKMLSTTKSSLRYNYGVKFEDKKALERNKKPYHSFMTNNFISTKNIMKKIPFSEKLLKYGQEDTFLGFELKNNNVEIIHIDNSVFHLDIDSNSLFIKKMKCSMENLILLKTNSPEFIKYNYLLTLTNRFKIFKIKPIKILAAILSKLFEYMAKKTSSVYSFQLFKFFFIISRS